LPVIASTVGGNPEVISDGESGLLFPVADSGALTARLVLLKEQRQLREHLSQHAMQHVNHKFSLESMVAEYEQMYSSLLPNRNVTAA
jgi:L-malate glycosyltransferase